MPIDADPYGEGLYTHENIVGYTGDLKVSPTVYFQNSHYRGRITQDHPNPDNIGRAEVRSVVGYSCANKLVERHGAKERRFVERDGGTTHTSRGARVERDEIGKKDIAILGLAITRFPGRKPKDL